MKSRYTNVKYHCELSWYFSVPCLPQSLRNYKEEAKIKPSQKALAMPGQWGRDKIAAILQTTYSNEFYWMKIYEFFLKFHKNTFLLGDQLTKSQHWIRQATTWTNDDQATNVNVLVTRSRWDTMPTSVWVTTLMEAYFTASWWRHNGCDSVSNHQPYHCLLNRLFRRRSKKTSKLRVTGLCVGNSPGTGEFPAQMTSNAENVSIWWRHHEQWLGQPAISLG